MKKTRKFLMVSLLCTLFLTAGVQTLAVSKQFGNNTHAWWAGSGPSGSHSQYLHNTRPHGSSVTKGDQIDGRQASAGKWANSRLWIFSGCEFFYSIK